MSEFKNSSEFVSASAESSNGKKSANRRRTKARSQFDASAPLIPLEKFFSGFQEVKRSNVEVTLDEELLNRVATPYVEKALDYSDSRDLPVETEINYQRGVYGLVGFGLVRKLLKSLPASAKPRMSKFKFISDTDYYVPPALAATLDNVGKVSADDFTLRIRYHDQDIVRFLLQTLKGLSTHDQFSEKYCSPVKGVSWEELDPQKCVYPCDGSVRWLGDYGRDVLEYASFVNFSATYWNGDEHEEITVSFPRVKLSEEKKKRVDEIVSWLKILPKVPGHRQLAAAALLTVMDVVWLERPNSKVREFIPGVDAVYNMTIKDLLDLNNFHLIGVRQHNVKWVRHDEWMQFALDAFMFLSSSSRINYGPFLKFTKQPDTEFGTLAQILQMNGNAWKRVSSRAPGYHYMAQRSEMDALVLKEISDKSVVTAGLIFGFSKKVTYHNHLSARLNGNPNTVRMSFVSSDFQPLA